MVQADGADIGVSLFIVVLGQAIPGTPVDPHRFAMEKRKTVVRNVVFVLEKVTEVHLGRRAKAQAESWSEALAGYFDMISVDDIGVVGGHLADCRARLIGGGRPVDLIRRHWLRWDAAGRNWKFQINVYVFHFYKSQNRGEY